jgi:hypothetical protein
MSLSCWRHNRFALNHWKLATRCYQFPEHQETMPSASPQTPPSHWLDGDFKGALTLVKTRLWFGVQIPALNLMAGDSFDMWEWHDQENVISEKMWKYSSRNNRDSWPCDWGYPSTSTQLAL